MLTGQVPFGGPIAVVMAQHQHAALPLEKLASVPQPAVGLIERLLDKDPARRFQTPAELLKALAAIMEAIGKGSTISYISLEQVADQRGYSPTRKASAAKRPENISIARLPVTGSDLLAGMRISLSWMPLGKIRMSMSSRSLPGLVSVSRR